ncbi:MAG: RNA pyrophosphohydrolase [Alphaproteobacteria bacterium]
MARSARVDPATLPYRRGVGIVLFNREGLVFVAKRIDAPGGAWQMPQGGIDRGEKPRTAALRELAEETGIGAVEFLAESAGWLTYELPAHLLGKAWRGRYRGQRQKWFALSFTGSDRDIDLRATAHPEFDDWRWVELARTPSMIVPFKRDLYERVAAEFAALATPRTDGARAAREGDAG